MDNPELNLILAHNNAMTSSHGKLSRLLSNKDIPLFLQTDKELHIARIFQDVKIDQLQTLDDWKMNLMVVSE
jgi:hypothetical protein